MVAVYLNSSPGWRFGMGAYLHIPEGVVHGFHIESDAVSRLNLTTPNHGEFYQNISLLFRSTINDEVNQKASQNYEVELVGPLTV